MFNVRNLCWHRYGRWGEYGRLEVVENLLNGAREVVATGIVARYRVELRKCAHCGQSQIRRVAI